MNSDSSLPNFPVELPMDSVKRLIEIIKNGEILTESIESIKLILWITGSTIEVFTPPTSSVGILENQTVTSVANEVLVLCENQLESITSDVSTKGINPLLLIKLFRLFSLLMK